MVEAPAPAPAPLSDGGISAEIMSRHGRSTQPESQQLVAVLMAVKDVIVEQGLSISPTAMFAATMSALDKPETKGHAEVALAMCTLLGVVLPRLPNSILRSKFQGCSTVLCSVLDAHKQQASVAKAALGCLSAVLSALDPTNWPAALPPFSVLLSFVTDGRPKVRKRAAAGMLEVLAAVRATPAHIPASDALLRVCQVLLPAPAATAKAAAAASNKQRTAAEDAIAHAVADALHLMGLLKELLPLLAGPAVRSIVDLLFQLYTLRQPLLSRHTTQALTALVSSRSAALPAVALAELLAVVVDSEGSLWERKDPEGVLAITRLLEAGFLRLHDLDPAMASARLPRAVHALLPQLAAEQDGVRFGTAQALRALLHGCVDADMVATGLAGPNASPPPPIRSVVAAIASALGPRYQEAWAVALPVAGELVEALGNAGGGALAGEVITQLGLLCAGAADAQAEDGNNLLPTGRSSSAAVTAAAEAALGCALRSLGPAAVLEVLPLNFQEGLAGTAEPRTWLLPLLRKHVRHTSLAYWGSHLCPAAMLLAARATAATAAGQTPLAASCHTLEMQIWAALPSFASWATDLPTAYPAVVKQLAGAFANRPELRPTVCSALQRMTHQIRSVLRASGAGPDLIGYADPLGATRHHHHRPAAGGVGGGRHGGSSGGARSRRGASSASVATSGPGGEEEEEEADEVDAYLERAPAGGGNGPLHLRGGGDGEEDVHDLHGTAPKGYTPEVARAALDALRRYAGNWIKVLRTAFLEAPAEGRGHIAGALSSYAAITDAPTLAPLFREALTTLLRLIKEASAVTGSEAAAGGSTAAVAGGVTGLGGLDPVTQRVSYSELALTLAAGVDDIGVATLFKACKPGLLDRDPAIQKKSYKLLAYITNERPTFVRSHLKDVLTAVLAGSAASVAAAKRYRLRALQPLVLLLTGAAETGSGGGESNGLDDALLAALPAPAGGDIDDGMAVEPEDRRRQLVAALVGEIILACKEVNTKTREAAYTLLVGLARAMDEADPPAPVPGSGPRFGSGVNSDDEYGATAVAADGGMDVEGPAATGGLHNLFSIAMAGLVGTTPHMISASVLALARLLFEFAPRLSAVAPALLPAVLMLLRTKSREVVKAVLGFIKVCAMRLPTPVLAVHLKSILEGVLLWADDSKNKFKLKIRVIVERLSRRLGYDAMAAAIPPSDAKLLAHIRKAANRKERLRAGSRAGSQAGDEEAGDDDGGRSVRSGRTARPSEWGHTAIFSERGAEEDARSRKSARTAATSRPGGKSDAGGGPRGRAGRTLPEEGAGGDEPMDLLEPSVARKMVKHSVGARDTAAADGEVDDFGREAGSGKMVIEEEDPFAWQKRISKRKRKAADGYDSDDSDLDELKGFAGLSSAMKAAGASKSVRFAPSLSKSTARSAGGRSAGGKSARTAGGVSAGGRSAASKASSKASGKSAAHTGDRYKPKRAGTGGDMAGRSAKVEPYAYWSFDRKMLNRRKGKHDAASGGLSRVVSAVAAGAARGAKAKRAAGGGVAKRRATGEGGQNLSAVMARRAGSSAGGSVQGRE